MKHQSRTLVVIGFFKIFSFVAILLHDVRDSTPHLAIDSLHADEEALAQLVARDLNGNNQLSLSGLDIRRILFDWANHIR